MIEIAHLGDDHGLGGVNRSVDTLLARLDMSFGHSRRHVAPTREAPPALDARIIVIHFTASWRKLAWLYGLRARNPKAALILVEHSYTRAFERLHVKDRIRFRIMLKLTYALMERVVAVSAAQARWLADAASLPAGRLITINPAIDLDSLMALPLPARRSGPLRLCGYGRYCPQKGFDTLIAAMRLLPAEIATLRLVGLGPDEAKLRDHATNMMQVSVEGPVSGPSFLLRDVDAMAIPSRFEAFGSVGAEARAAGRPIIVSAVDGLIDQALPPPELTVPPEDPAALAAAIAWLARQDISALGATARKSVAGTTERTVEAWNLLLDDVARERRLASAA